MELNPATGNPTQAELVVQKRLVDFLNRRSIFFIYTRIYLNKLVRWLPSETDARFSYIYPLEIIGDDKFLVSSGKGKQLTVVGSMRFKF